jgi:hypothetical protein
MYENEQPKDSVPSTDERRIDSVPSMDSFKKAWSIPRPPGPHLATVIENSRPIPSLHEFSIFSRDLERRSSSPANSGGTRSGSS